MYMLKIIGNKKLEGTVKISGAKNSAVGLIPAAILCDEDVEICNVPNISDIDNLKDMLKYLNVDYSSEQDSIKIIPNTLKNKPIPSSITRRLRASYYFMGALLGKHKRVEISLPGGCSIGARPINLHLKGFEALGATITESNDKIIIEANELIGNHIYLDFASVGATINIIFAAVKANGVTIIENAAKEPEIVDICNFLNHMGANIKGAGTNTIKIKGVKYLHTCVHEVIPDRIEAGTYMIIAAATGKRVKIENIIPEHLEALIQKLKEMHVNMTIDEDNIIIEESKNLKSTSVTTLVYPGFPTDLQQVIATLMTQAQGRSMIEETIFENRFQNLYELQKMGAKIKINGNKALIYGPCNLTNNEINASDLRAGAGLIVAALLADGETVINNADYILRGYGNIVENLTSLGAKIELIKI